MALLPVMVYIHGGGFKQGNFEVDAGGLVRQKMVLVTINYRLGMLGE